MDLGPASVDQCQNLGRCSWRGGRSLSLGLVLRFRKVAGAEIGLWLAEGGAAVARTENAWGRVAAAEVT